jgi:3-oxoadipate enol-lactonase
MFQVATATGVIAYELLDTVGPAAKDAPFLTLLHNFMSTGRAAWGALLSVLNQRFRILLPDLPGHGRSLGHPAGYDHTLIAGQIAELMHMVGAEAGHLAGCSSGGMIAQLIVAEKLAQPATLTLVSATHSTDPRRTGAANPLTPERFEASRTWLQATARLHDPFQGEGYFDGTLLPGFRGLTPASAIDLPLSAFRDFDLPVCIIHGDHDEFFPVSIARSMTAALPSAELRLVPRQTHALLFRQPNEVAQIMDDFLRRHA